jgi:hypothetical protein
VVAHLAAVGGSCDAIAARGGPAGAGDPLLARPRTEITGAADLAAFARELAL